LHQLGEYQEARREDTLARRRQLLGENHPDTRLSAGNLAEVWKLGEACDAAQHSTCSESADTGSDYQHMVHIVTWRGSSNGHDASGSVIHREPR
jgi:hypothetical protein